ncbi:MAG: hypothetical protein JW843_09995 [Candidatus Aminicenantes bacterium]|nr:hypothetical protein [Candidatus Aminicenantes bacterium]
MPRTSAVCAPLFGLILAVLAAASPAQEKLPGGVSYRLREADRLLQPGERAMRDGAGVASTEWKIKTAEQAVKSAKEKMKEIGDKFAGQYSPRHPDVVKILERIAALEAAIGGKVEAEGAAAAQASAEADASAGASAPWLSRLKPFVIGIGRPGHDPARYLIPSATQEAAEMAVRLKIYSTASEALREYREAKVASPTDELLDAAAQLEKALADFSASVREYADSDLEEAGRKLDDLAAFTKTQQDKRKAGQPFLFADKDQFISIRLILERAARLLDSRDRRLQSLWIRLDSLSKSDTQLREARIAETNMLPDRYRGADLAAIKAKAGAILMKSKPGAIILARTVISSEWKEESVIEYTDTTRTALRHRVTRSLTVQVGTREGSGNRLHTLFIGMDRRADGHWGEMYGHVMFTDPILEQNIIK